MICVNVKNEKQQHKGNILFCTLVSFRLNAEQTSNSICTFNQFLLTVPHHMDIFNTDELKLYIGVVILIFIALSCSPVCHCIQLKTKQDYFILYNLAIICTDYYICMSFREIERLQLTLGLVSTTYMNLLLGLDFIMASSICSSSKQRALKPDRGWLLRHMAAWHGKCSCGTLKT